MINNLTILRTVKKNLPAFTIPHRLNRILQVLFIFLIPGIILLVGNLILAKPAELPQDDTTISEIAVTQNLTANLDTTSQPDAKSDNVPDEKLDIELNQTTNNTEPAFEPVKAEPAILLVALNDDGTTTATACALLNEDDSSTYVPIEASYSYDPYEYDPVGAELEQIITGDTSAYVQNASAEHLAQLDPNRYTVDPLEQLTQLNGDDSLLNHLDPTRQNNPTGQLQPVGNNLPTNQAVNTVQYHYNGDGHLVGKTVDGVKTDFALDIAGGLPEVIYTSDGNRYLHLPGVIMAENAAGDVRYLLMDGLGSVRQVVDEEGEVVASYDFDPYGNLVNGSGGDPYGYTGEWWENDIGLLHLRTRWYMPGTGTFLSQDSWEGDPLLPQSMNGYNYVAGNPVNLVDPSGQCPPGQNCAAKINEIEGRFGVSVDDQFMPWAEIAQMKNLVAYQDRTLECESNLWTETELERVYDGLEMLQVGRRVGLPPAPRCRNGVNSPHLPAYIFLVLGDARCIAPKGENSKS